MSNTELIQLTVTGMSCSHCEKRLTLALNRLQGVKDATASAQDNSVTVTVDTEKANLEQIREAIIDCGYTPQ